MLLLLQGVYKVLDFLSTSRLSLSFVSGTYQQGHYNQTVQLKKTDKAFVLKNIQLRTAQCIYNNVLQ